MSVEWKSRGKEERPYQARRILHSANTSIEYGEKTWTTAQTVRDLMQNHLDAETEKYFKSISALVFDAERLQSCLEKQNGSLQKETENFLHAVYTFANHAKDMTPETRAMSEAHLQKLSNKLPFKEGVRRKGTFSPALFMEQAQAVAPQKPLVSYEVIDAQTKKSLGWLPYETLRDEPLYHETLGGVYIYKINGMKIVDRGSGYDSQLAALYISSKTGKKHARGKFGEGAKMSELHLLRHGAEMKMRSQYKLKDGAEEKNRLWQAKSKLRQGRFALEGIEIETQGTADTGSTTIISLKGAQDAFRREMLENIDPRRGGLAKNISEFDSLDFIYPMPIAEKFLAGINMAGQGDAQYVQGLRVELAAESFGYAQPWYSYDFLDSGIIAGRDRNEITNGITKRIETFWDNNDNPELLARLAQTVVHDKSKGKNWSSPELTFFGNILYRNIGNSSEKKDNRLNKIQKIVDEALFVELALEEGVPTLVLSAGAYNDSSWRKYIDYAEDEGYQIKTIAASVPPGSISAFAKRLPEEYQAVSLWDIQSEMRSKEEAEKPADEFREGEKEKAIRGVFSAAMESFNAFLSAAGFPPQEFTLNFAPRNKAEEEEDEFSFHSRAYNNDFSEPNPLRMRGRELLIEPYEVSDPRHGSEQELRQSMELAFLSACKSGCFEADDMDETEYYDAEFMESNENYLKDAQFFLNELMEKFIPADSPLLAAIPESFDYAKNSKVMTRLMEAILNNNEIKQQKEKMAYEAYRKALSPELKLEEAQKMLDHSIKHNQYKVKSVLERRVFLMDGVLHSYNLMHHAWEELRLEEKRVVAEWRGHAVYKLADGRFFVAAPMAKGAVLSKGEGKNKEYVINEGDDFLQIGKYGVGFDNYDTRSDKISVHPAGLVLFKNEYADTLATTTYVQEQLKEYSYFPSGSAENKNTQIIEGVVATDMPVEYGKDEWDNPIRVFQDIIQNHVDAAVGPENVKLSYEVDRGGQRMWVSNEDIAPSDNITGLMISDNGAGYAPSDIATMGASSKKSPLFAGKYGEGQKMVAAAALRSGLDLEYQSMVQAGSEKKGWRARVVSEPRQVVLDGRKVEKKLVAFDVAAADNQPADGSCTILRLSDKALSKETEQWSQWVSIIDPRQKDGRGNSGLARFIRQLRQLGSDREYRVGNISILLDEPGAVYENGLRINPNTEGGRALSFGYDVPEIVTTRERNSYNADRLKYYMQHVIAHITDHSIIKELLEKMASAKNSKNPDLNISAIMNRTCAVPVWAEAAQEKWPGYLVHSSAKLYADMNDNGLDEYGFPTFGYESEFDRKERMKRVEEARRIHLNMVHVDRKKLLDVSEESYRGFAMMLPTAEDFLEKLETKTLPITPETKKTLSKIVAESAKVFLDVFSEAQKKAADYHLNNILERANYWVDADKIEKYDHGVAVAPITATFQGRAGNGVVFNEELLLGGNKHEFAAVSLHEMAHLVSGSADYTEDFVGLLYKLVNHFVLSGNTKLNSQEKQAVAG